MTEKNLLNVSTQPLAGLNIGLVMNLISSSTAISNARSIGLAFAHAHGLTLGAWTQFPSLDKTIVVFHFMKDGEAFEPSRADGRFAFNKMPRLCLRADGTVFRDLLFNPFA